MLVKRMTHRYCYCDFPIYSIGASNNELLLEQISAGFVGPSRKIYQTLNLRFKVIVSDLDLNADSFLDCIRAIAHNL
jgi:hypothetical protein